MWDFSEKIIVCFGEAPFWRRLQVELKFLQPVMAEQNVSKGLSTMTEIKTKKPEAERWKKTEGPDEGVSFVFCDYH